MRKTSHKTLFLPTKAPHSNSRNWITSITWHLPRFYLWNWKLKLRGGGGREEKVTWAALCFWLSDWIHSAMCWLKPTFFVYQTDGKRTGKLPPSSGMKGIQKEWVDLDNGFLKDNLHCTSQKNQRQTYDSRRRKVYLCMYFQSLIWGLPK